MDHLVAQLLKDLDELTLLKTFVETEALVFFPLFRFGPALGKFINVVSKIVFQIIAIREILERLLHNKTQAKFVKFLKPSLEDLSADMEILVFMVDEYMGIGTSFTIRVYPTFIYILYDQLRYYFCCCCNSPIQRAVAHSLDNGWRSNKHDGMLDRRKYFRNSLHPEEEEEKKCAYKGGKGGDYEWREQKDLERGHRRRVREVNICIYNIISNVYICKKIKDIYIHTRKRYTYLYI